jgi:hypothetical protein
MMKLLVTLFLGKNPDTGELMHFRRKEADAVRDHIIRETGLLHYLLQTFVHADQSKVPRLFAKRLVSTFPVDLKVKLSNNSEAWAQLVNLSDGEISWWKVHRETEKCYDPTPPLTPKKEEKKRDKDDSFLNVKGRKFLNPSSNLSPPLLQRKLPIPLSKEAALSSSQNKINRGFARLSLDDDDEDGITNKSHK